MKPDLRSLNGPSDRIAWWFSLVCAASTAGAACGIPWSNLQDGGRDVIAAVDSTAHDANELADGADRIDAGFLPDVISVSPDVASPPDGSTGGCYGLATVCSSSRPCCDGMSCAAGFCATPSGCSIVGGACSGASSCCAGTRCGGSRVCLPLDCLGVDDPCLVQADCCVGSTCNLGHCDCPLDTTRCASSPGVIACTNTRIDVNNCGSCGHRCGPGGSCVASTCACDVMHSLCGAVCVDLTTNASNCGACGHACGPGFTCDAGVCVCGSSQTICGTSCVFLVNDPFNCGRCGNACGAGAACFSGACGCVVPLVACPGGCANLSYDPMNCGSCGRLCVVPRPSCVSGTCT